MHFDRTASPIARHRLHIACGYEAVAGKVLARPAAECDFNDMNLLILIVVLLLLFGGGGFYFGGPVIGGGGLGLILLICLVIYFMGGFRGSKRLTAESASRLPASRRAASGCSGAAKVGFHPIAETRPRAQILIIDLRADHDAAKVFQTQRSCRRTIRRGALRADTADLRRAHVSLL